MGGGFSSLYPAVVVIVAICSRILFMLVKYAKRWVVDEETVELSVNKSIYGSPSA